MAAAFRLYNDSFNRNPSRTLMITNGVLTAFADTVAQYAEMLFSKDDNSSTARHYDPFRTLRFFAFGFGMGPLLGRWNMFLEHTFPLRSVGGKISTVSMSSLAKRVICDQIIMAPVGLVIFTGSMGVMEGKTLEQIKKKYKDMYWSALIANWQVWPAAQLINFRYMPLPYRVPFQATLGVFWSLYLSLLNARASKNQNEEVAY
ncbi:hypothetical protein DACRYDRAFT_24860 [Dacryopinax primogenitus]|uniref:Uncharacterized protein n=1 Tax=Dacryopinax primogenitus (strain DJM 731) TaxID=1858805 RepID=M5FWW7_DACPD|nr:uncharacterized protein DACRYDRAFT_24860 [Dacryopinax primogenitus]EJT97946.1 hypothetical protein DACRYDRAFT_24860 [Dacryopinax primogenitus]